MTTQQSLHDPWRRARGVRLTAVICLVGVVLAGCVNTRAIRYETQTRDPKPADFPLEILDPVNVTRPYKVIGVVQANTGKRYDPARTIEALKEEARKLGGDALIDLQQGSGGGGAAVPVAGGMYAYGNIREIWTAKVIVWIAPDGKEGQ